MKRATRIARLALAGAALLALSGGGRAVADMELAPPPQADFENAQPEVAAPPPADAVPAAPEIADDEPSDYQQAAPEIGADAGDPHAHASRILQSPHA